MSDEIEKIFTATAQSPWQFLSFSGQGYYIPAYQRAYSWDAGNVDRLLEDALNGLNQLMVRPRTISFLGTIIAIHDTKYRTVKPIFRTSVPSRVMTIIDGQQRICTLVMLNIALHDFLRRQVHSLLKRKEESFIWAVDQCQVMLAALEETFQIDMRTGDKRYRYYPRITRAYDDAWSKREAEAQYNSPIARLVWEYIAYDQTSTKTFRFPPKSQDGTTLPQLKSVADIFFHMQRAIVSIARGSDPDDFPELVQIVRKDAFCEAVLGQALPDYVSDFIADNLKPKGQADLGETLRAILLAKYINNRMAFTIVTTESEDDAFDMFEALNTTGEPLTAFETFKPRVIDAEGIEKFEMSPSRTYVTAVEQYLDNFRKADARQTATSELLVPFALAETGERLQKRLNDQRRYLRDEFDAVKDIDGKRDFVRSLAHMATFMRSAWNAEDPDFAPVQLHDDQAMLCFYALRHLKHNITVAPLARFYDAARRSESAEREAKTADLAAAMRATAAFSMLWRSAKGGTENIDAHYRGILKEGLKNGDGTFLPALCRRPETGFTSVSLPNYRKRLRAILLTNFAPSEKWVNNTHDERIKGARDEWVRAAARIPIYKHSRVIARFMLLCAAHDAVPDTEAPGLIRRGVSGVAPLLSSATWNDPSYLTVEHVAPQRISIGWDKAFDDDPDSLDRLGNLTLLPQIENSVVANRPWQHKLFLYRMLVAETHEQRSAIKIEAESSGFVLGVQTDTAMAQAKHLNLCRSIVAVPGAWSVSLVEQRSRRLAELAWDVLAPWLDLSSGSPE